MTNPRLKRLALFGGVGAALGVGVSLVVAAFGST